MGSSVRFLYATNAPPRLRPCAQSAVKPTESVGHRGTLARFPDELTMCAPSEKRFQKAEAGTSGYAR
jgi:hypothetical protein